MSLSRAGWRRCLTPDWHREELPQSPDEGSRVLDVVGLVNNVQPLVAPSQETKLRAKDKEHVQGGPVWMGEHAIRVLLEVSPYLLGAGASSS